MIGLRGPFGAGWPMTQAEGHDVVIVAGGIGLAPLRPCIYHLLAARRRYASVVLLFGARSPRDIIFASELRKWGQRSDIQVLTTVDRAGGDWRGNVGVVTTLVERASFSPERTIGLICGPEIMMRFTVKSLQARGVPRQNVFVSMERNMKCAIGLCGHCQYGPEFICKDGPVFPFERIERLVTIREL
jgi:NAD(P)H-flavin reductase